MKKSQFKSLLKRYLNNRCTEEERQLVESWYELIGSDNDVDITDVDDIEDKLWEKIQSKTNQQQIRKTRQLDRKIKRRQWLSIAAVILPLILAGSIFLLVKNGTISGFGKDALAINYNQVENNGTEDKIIWLEDSTKVSLAPNSKIVVPKSFDSEEKRVVELTGVAIFDVTENPLKPFYVYSEDLVTRVLGTSFKIDSHTKDEIVVEVLSGKVSVYNEQITKNLPKNLPQKGSGVVLTPNEKVTYHAAQKHFITSVVNEPILLSQSEEAEKIPTFIYEETPIETVFEEIEKNYSIQIVVDNDRFNSCPLTANLSNQPFFTKLEMICTSFNATYEVKGTTILINGRGCN